MSDSKKKFIKSLFFIISIEIIFKYNCILISGNELIKHDETFIYIQDKNYIATKKYLIPKVSNFYASSFESPTIGDTNTTSSNTVITDTSMIDTTNTTTGELDPNGNFVTNSVIVVLKKSVSEVNKEWQISDFPEAGIESIRDQTRIDGDVSSSELNLDDFHQILLFTLIDKSKEGVLQAVSQLQSNPYIESVDPNYIAYPDFENPTIGDTTSLNMAITDTTTVDTTNITTGIPDSNSDFALDSVIVVLKKSVSEVNKEWQISDFPEAGIESIRDQTRIDGDVSSSELNLDDFHQIYLFTLVDKSREGVLQAINQLQSNPYIEAVDPNYYGYPELETPTIGDTTSSNTVIAGTTTEDTTNTTGASNSNGDFALDSVIVVLKKSVSEVNKEWQISDFPEAGIESIRDQTRIDGDVSSSELNLDDFHQIYLFTLIDKSREGVLQAINQLQSNPNIEAVDPNYYTYPDMENPTIGDTTSSNTVIADTTAVDTTNTTGVSDSNDNFATDSVIVVLKKSVSEVNKEWQISDFPEAGIESIRDQTRIDGDVSSSELNLDDFHQIYLFTLIDKSREGVLQAINQLQSNPYIESVDPNYYGYPELENTTIGEMTTANTTNSTIRTTTTANTTNTTKGATTTANTTNTTKGASTTANTTNATKGTTISSNTTNTTKGQMTSANTADITRETMTTVNTTNTTKGTTTTVNTTNTTKISTTSSNTTNTTKGQTTTANTTNITKGQTTTANTTNTTKISMTSSNTTNTTKGTTTTANTTNTTRVSTTSANTTNTTKVSMTSLNTTNTTKVLTTSANTTNTTKVSTTSSNTTNTTKVSSTTANTTKEMINTTINIQKNTTSEVNATVNNVPTLLAREQVTINQGSTIDLRSLILEAKDAYGNDLKNDVVYTGEVNTAKAGAYTIIFSVTDKNGMTKATKSIISVRGEETVIIGDNAIDAHDFSLSVSEAQAITEEQILAKAGVNAWNIPSGDDLTDIVKIDKTELKSSIGQYKIAININLLKATIGKNNSGEDAAIVIVTVCDDHSNGSNNNNIVLPITGENNWMIKLLCKLEKFITQLTSA